MKHFPRRVVLVCAGVALMMGACSSDGGSDVDLSGDPELESGSEVYSASCASCHGPEGGGGTGPKLSDGSTETSFPDIEDQIAVITEGIGAMPSWEGRLTPEEIRAVARYEREVL